MPTFTNNLVVGGHISLATPLFTGSSAVDSASAYGYDVVLGGVGYLLDLKSGNYAHQSVPLLRPQSDSSSEPAEASVNSDDFWRRGQSSWHLGAGQTWLDRPESSRQRFNASKGVDIWTENQIGLLNDTDAKLTSANTNLKMVVAGSRIYVLDGTALKYVTSPTDGTWSTTSVTGLSGNALLDIASDGYNVWVTDGATVYSTNTGTGAASSFSTEDIDVLGFAKGRLLGAEDGQIFYWDGAAFTSLYTQGSGSAFTWIGFAEGHGAVYAAGYAGDKSLIYRIEILTSGAGLDVPVVAGELPDGEIIRSIYGYLGFIFLGTDKGVRYCEVDSQNNLIIGAPFGPSAAPYCFEGQDRYVWFGWTNYDSTSTGLGRCTPRRFGDPEDLKPAYATDLMTPGGSTVQGAVQGVVTFSNKRYFSVSGAGFYGQDTPLVSSGKLDTGRFSWGLPETKIGVSYRAQFGPDFDGSYTASTAEDGSSTFADIGTHTDTAADTTGVAYTLSETEARSFEVRHTLTRGSDTSTGPELTSWVVRAQPAPALTHRIVLPILIAERLEVDGTEVYAEPATELARIKDWHASREVLAVIEGEQSSSVMVDDFDFRPSHRTVDRRAWNGTCLTVLKVVA